MFEAMVYGQSSRSGMGAIPYDGGTMFRVWAPNAESVGVKGAFSDWNTLSLVAEGDGNWSADVDGAVHGQDYKYVITQNGWTFDRVDARSLQLYHSTGNCSIYDQGQFDWQGDSFSRPWFNDMVIYQMHIGTYKADSRGWTPGEFSDAISKLDHLQDMGINVIQLMPVCEFAGSLSMGYNPAMPYAVETDYGGPDGLKEFVREAHSRGIAVLLDMVHNHYGPTDNLLWQFDGWNYDGLGGIYFYQDGRRVTPWGDSRPDYGRSEVQSYISDNFKMWVDDFHVDGFRWDSVYNIKYTDWGENSSGVWLVQTINSMLHSDYPGLISIAEDNAYGLGFDAEWEAGNTDEFGARVKWVLTQGSDADRDMDLISWEVNDGQGYSRVIYTESHDMVNEENGKVRLPVAIDASNPESIWARKRVLLGATMTMTSVGIPMIFQGQELLETWGFKPQNAMRWERAVSQEGILNAYTDLVGLRRNLAGDTQGLKGTGANVYHVDNSNKVVAYHRWDQGGVGDDTVVVLNFGATSWTNDSYWIDFPYEGDWYVLFNSDATRYGADFGDVGDTVLTASGSPPRAAVNMGMYGALVLGRSKHALPSAGTAVTDPAAPELCEDVTIRYTPDGGPLSGADPVHIFIGRNDWQDIVDPAPAMTWQDDAWVYVYSPTNDTATIDFIFRDADAQVWDNNLGHDWQVAMSKCADYTPSEVTVTPEFPTACDPVQIVYTPHDGVLSNASAVQIHMGIDDWAYTMSPARDMVPTGTSFAFTFTPPVEMSQLDFVFRNTDGSVWDNNGGENWMVNYASCGDERWVRIDVPQDGVSVTTATIRIEGAAQMATGDTLQWIHSAQGLSGMRSATDEWSFAEVPLVLGTNILAVAVYADGHTNGASDHADDAVYASTWITGQNGGEGFEAWLLKGGSSSGHFLATTGSLDTLEMDARAWGLWSSESELAEAARSFSRVLGAGSRLSLDFENGYIDTDKSVGIGLLNAGGEKLFEFYFQGGDDQYRIRDNQGVNPTGLSWTDAPMHLELTLIDALNYTFCVNGTCVHTGALVRASDPQIRTFRAWNFGAGSGENHNFYLGHLQVEGEQWVAFDTLSLVRLPTGDELDTDDDGLLDTWEQQLIDADPEDAVNTLGDVLPGDDFDQDGVSNLDEHQAGTDAADATSFLRISLMDMSEPNTVALQFPSSSGRRYVIWNKASLGEGAWTNISPYQDIWGTGNDLQWSHSGPDAKGFYRLEVQTGP